MQVSDDIRGELTLERVIYVLEYVLKKELLVLQPGDELTRPSLDLLASIFDYCEELCWMALINNLLSYHFQFASLTMEL